MAVHDDCTFSHCFCSSPSQRRDSMIGRLSVNVYELFRLRGALPPCCQYWQSSILGARLSLCLWVKQGLWEGPCQLIAIRCDFNLHLFHSLIAESRMLAWQARQVRILLFSDTLSTSPQMTDLTFLRALRMASGSWNMIELSIP